MLYVDHVRGLREAMKFTEDIIESTADYSEELQMLGDQIVADINSNIQNGGHVVTGETLSHSKVFEVGTHHVVVGNDAPWIYWLENGRGPVYPIHAKMLHWVDKYTGEDVFRYSAGPAEPTHVVEDAVIVNTEMFSDLVARRLKRIG